MSGTETAKPLFEMGEDPIVVGSGPQSLNHEPEPAPVARPLRVTKLEPSAPSAGERREYGAQGVLLALGDAATRGESPRPAPETDAGTHPPKIATDAGTAAGTKTQTRPRTDAGTSPSTKTTDAGTAPSTQARTETTDAGTAPSTQARAETTDAGTAPSTKRTDAGTGGRPTTPAGAASAKPKAPVGAPIHPKETPPVASPPRPVLPTQAAPRPQVPSPGARPLVSPVFGEEAASSTKPAVKVTKVLEDDDEPAVPMAPASEAAERLQGAFAKLPSLEPEPARLPDHVDRSAKPTHTFGASALRDAVASLGTEGGLGGVKAKLEAPEAREEPDASTAATAPQAKPAKMSKPPVQTQPRETVDAAPSPSPFAAIQWGENPAAESTAELALPRSKPAPVSEPLTQASRSRAASPRFRTLAAAAGVIVVVAAAAAVAALRGPERLSAPAPAPTFAEPELVLEAEANAEPAPGAEVEAQGAEASAQAQPDAAVAIPADTAAHEVGGEAPSMPEAAGSNADAVDSAKDAATVTLTDAEPEAAGPDPDLEGGGPPSEEERRALRREIMRQLSLKANRPAAALGARYERDFVFDWELHIKLAHAARLARDRELALRWFTEFVERYPENMYVDDAAFWVAQIRWQSQGLDDAVAYLEAVSSDRSVAWSGAAQAQLRRLVRIQAEAQ